MFENGEPSEVPRYKFYADRYLTGMILDEQKKLYNQTCFVEDLQIEMNNRRNPPATQPIPPHVEDFPLPTSENPIHEEPCESCQ